MRIVAADVRTALGDDLDATWSALLEGRSAVAPVTGFDASGFGAPHAAQVWTTAPEPETDTAQRVLGRHAQLLDVVLKRLHETAGLASAPRDRVGLFVCTGMADTPVGDLVPAVLDSRDEEGRFDVGRYFAGGYRRLHPLWPLAALQNVGIGQIAIDLDVRGDNVVTSAEADAAVRTLVEAAYAAKERTADHVLVGGGSFGVSPGHLARLRLRGGLGDGPAFPASTDGDGASPGEAAGALLVERADAEGGRRPPARLRGGGTAFDRAEGRPGPTELAFRLAIEAALAAAETNGDAIDAVFLHAEGHAEQDAAELRAVNQVAGAGPDGPALVATRGALGHAAGAAPIVDVALALRALEAGVLPPTVVGETTLDEADGRLLPEPREARLRRVLVVAAGSEGGAGALVLEAAS